MPAGPIEPPALLAVGTALSSVPAGFKLPPSLTANAVRLVMDFTRPRAPAGFLSPTAVALAQDVSRGLLMSKATRHATRIL